MAKTGFYSTPQHQVVTNDPYRKAHGTRTMRTPEGTGLKRTGRDSAVVTVNKKPRT